VPGIAQNLLCRSFLHDPAQVHHRYTASNLTHHRKIVRDEQVRQTSLALKVGEQIQYLRLY
jgi:capsid protein